MRLPKVRQRSLGSKRFKYFYYDKASAAQKCENQATLLFPILFSSLSCSLWWPYSKHHLNSLSLYCYSSQRALQVKGQGDSFTNHMLWSRSFWGVNNTISIKLNSLALSWGSIWAEWWENTPKSTANCVWINQIFGFLKKWSSRGENGPKENLIS